MFIYSLYLHTSMHTFLVLLPTAHFAGQRLLKIWYAAPPPGSGVYIAWQLLYCMCITYDFFTWQLLSVHYRWYMCMADGTVYVHVRVNAICCMCMIVACWLCMSDDICAWPLLSVHGKYCPCMTYDICVGQLMYVQCTWPLLSVHYRWCLFDSCCLCITAATCACQLLSFHGCSWLCMTKAVYYLWSSLVLGKCKANMGYLYVQCDYVKWLPDNICRIWQEKSVCLFCCHQYYNTCRTNVGPETAKCNPTILYVQYSNL